MQIKFEGQHVGFHPRPKSVLVKLHKEEERMVGGVYLPQAAHNSQLLGMVWAVGRRPDSEPCPYEVGDTVVVDFYSGKEVRLDDVVYMLIKSDDVLGAVR